MKRELKPQIPISVTPPIPAPDPAAPFTSPSLDKYGVRLDGTKWQYSGNDEEYGDLTTAEVEDVRDDLEGTVNAIVMTGKSEWHRVGTFKSYGRNQPDVDLEMNVYRMGDNAAVVVDERDPDGYTVFVGDRALDRAKQKAQELWNDSYFADSEY